MADEKTTIQVAASSVSAASGGALLGGALIGPLGVVIGSFVGLGLGLGIELGSPKRKTPQPETPLEKQNL